MSQTVVFPHLPRFFSVLFQTVPPKFSKDEAERTITLPVGGSTVIEVPFKASPTPKVTWSFNGTGKLPDAKRFKTTIITCMTSMTMAKVVRKDAGKYTLSVENELGKCELLIRLIVLGKTSAFNSFALATYIEIYKTLETKHLAIWTGDVRRG